MIADNALGLSLMKRDDESLHDYAMSFSPLAPLFGVPYRFSAMFKFPAAVTAKAAATAPAPAPEAASPKPAKKPAPALAAPEAPAPEPVKKAKKAKPKAKAKAEDLFEAEIDAGAAAAKAMAATTVAAFPDDMAEAAPGLEEALDAAPTAEPELVSEPVIEAAADATEAATEVVTAAPGLLYDSAPDLSDDLKLIKGVGPKLESELNGMGIYTFAQVASMNEANLAWIDGNLTTFKGRSLRDDWIGQASKLLAS